MISLDEELEVLVSEYLAKEKTIRGRKDIITALDAACKADDKLIDGIKAQIQTKMTESGLMTTRTKNFTISRKATAQSVIIADETLLPDNVVELKRVADKKLIKKMLNDGEVIPGVTLSNGGETIQVKGR